MAKYTAKEMCFFNGKRYRGGELVPFSGTAKDAPKYLEAAVNPEDEADEELEAVRAEYEELLGKKPHGRAGIDTLQKEIDDFNKS